MRTSVESGEMDASSACSPIIRATQLGMKRTRLWAKSRLASQLWGGNITLRDRRIVAIIRMIGTQATELSLTIESDPAMPILEVM
jgi:hypothetical protein